MLEVRNLNKKYQDLSVIDDFSITVRDGEVVALTGPSGCGKTTLLNIIAGLETSDSGTISSASKRISYMFQDTRLLDWRSVYENIKLVNDNASKEDVFSLIEEVGLKGFENYYPTELSGGMKKRVALARALSYSADILLMDEPFQGLDYGIRMEILNMLKKLWEKRRSSILFVTHEIDEALSIATRIVVVSKRPCTPIREFSLSGISERDVSNPEIASIRSECIKMIMGESND